MKTLKELLIELNACEESIEWAQDKTIEQAVLECERADWILWLSEKVKCDKSKLVLSGGLCANTVRHLITDERSIKAVDTAIYFGNGNATEQDLDAARDAARAAARAAAWGAAGDAAWAAARAAASAAGWAAAWAAARAAARAAAWGAAGDAARAAGWAAARAAAWAAAGDAARAAARAAASAAARAAALKEMAEIVRPIIANELIEKVNNLMP